MALDTVAAVINAISGDDATRRVVTQRALATSAIQRIKPAQRVNSPVVRYADVANITAHVTAEGETKTITSGAISAGYYQLLPLSLIIPVSNSLYNSSNDLQEAVIARLTEALAEGMDREILRNSDSKFSTSLVAAALAASNTKAAASASAVTYAEMNDTFGLVNADGFDVNGVIVRAGNMPALRASETTGGNRFFVPADSQRPSEIFGARTEVVSGRVLPMTGTTGETMAVVGDFNYLEWATWGDVQIRASEEASAGQFNAYAQNLVLVRAEIWFGFAVLNGNAFATLLEP